MWQNTANRALQDLRLAARNLIRHRRRSAFALCTVGGGVIAFLLAGGFIQWVLYGMREAAIHSQLGHIQITRPHFFSEGQSNPYRYLLPNKAPDTLTKPSPGIQTLAPRLVFGGLLSLGESTVSFLGEAIDPQKEAPITRAIQVLEGKDLTESAANAVILGEGLAASVDAKPGDRIVLLSTLEGGGFNAIEAQVAGIFATSTKAYDDVTLRAPLPIAHKLMGVNGATSWVMLLNDTTQTDPMVAYFRTQLDASQYEVTAWHELADFYNKTVALFAKQVGVVRLLIGFIVILSISNTLSMTVMERTSEIGTSMAVGVRRSGILRLFLSEGTLIGIAGGAGGVLIGTALAEIISAVGIPMPPPPGMTHGYTGQILVSPSLIIDALLLAIGTTLIASIFPAWKASRMTIVDALRHQR